MLTTNEVAKLLKVAPARVREIIRAGGLPAQKLGRDWFIEKKELEAYKTNRKKAGRPRKELENGENL